MKAFNRTFRKVIAVASVSGLFVASAILAGSATFAAAGKILIVDSEFNHKTVDPGREFESGGNMLV